jgi:hypothetical protein
MAVPRQRRLPQLVALYLCGIGAPGCEEYGPRIYTAHPYQAAARCIEASVAIGVVRTGELASSCAPQCLLLDSAVYVSVVCAPYPPRALVLDPRTSSDCAAALDVLESEAYCAAAPLRDAVDAASDSGE